MTDTTEFPPSGGGGGSRRLLLTVVAAVLPIVVIVLAVVYITGQNHKVSVLRAQQAASQATINDAKASADSKAAQDAKAASDAAAKAKADVDAAAAKAKSDADAAAIAKAQGDAADAKAAAEKAAADAAAAIARAGSPTYVYEHGYSSPYYTSSTVWGNYQLGSWIHDFVNIRTAPNTSSASAGKIYVGQNVPIVCSVVGERVTDSVGSSSNWDYVDGGWVPDEFVQTYNQIAPRC